MRPISLYGRQYDSYSLTLTLRTGKTLLAKTLARIANVPFVIADATSLTQAGLKDLHLKLFFLAKHYRKHCLWFLPKR